MKEEACFPEDPFYCNQENLYDEPSEFAVGLSQCFKYEITQEVSDKESLVLPINSDICPDLENNDDGEATESHMLTMNKSEKISSSPKLTISLKRNPVTKNRCKRLKKICPFFLYFASQKIPVQKTRFKEKLYVEIYKWNTLDVEEQRIFRELACDVVKNFEDAGHDSKVKQILNCSFIPIKNELLDGFYLYAAENRFILKKQKQSVTHHQVTYILKLIWNSFSKEIKEYYNNKAFSMNNDCNKYIELEFFSPHDDDEKFKDCDLECNPAEAENCNLLSIGMQRILRDDTSKLVSLGTVHAIKANKFTFAKDQPLKDTELKLTSNRSNEEDMQDLGYESLSTSPDICKTLQDPGIKHCLTAHMNDKIVKYFESNLHFTQANYSKHSRSEFFSTFLDEIIDTNENKLNLDFGVFYSDIHLKPYSPEVNGLVYDSEYGLLSSKSIDSEFGFCDCGFVPEFEFSYNDEYFAQSLAFSVHNNRRDIIKNNLNNYKNYLNAIESLQDCLLSSIGDPYKCLLSSQEFTLTNVSLPTNCSNLAKGKKGKKEMLNQSLVSVSLANASNDNLGRSRKAMDSDNYVYIDFAKNIYYDRVNRTVKGFSNFKLFNNAVGKGAVMRLQQPLGIVVKQNMTGFMFFSLEFHKLLKEKNPDLATEQMKSLSSSIWMNFTESEKMEYESLASINNKALMSDDNKKKASDITKIKRSSKKDVFICLECERKFHNPMLLSQHAKNSHQTSKAFRCVICFEMLSSSTCLAKHCRLLHSSSHSQRYTCEICLGTFAREALFNRHSRLKICTHPIMGFPWYLCEQQLKEFKMHEICKDTLDIMSYEKECWNSVKSILESNSDAYSDDYEIFQIDDEHNSEYSTVNVDVDFEDDDDVIVEENLFSDNESDSDSSVDCPDMETEFENEIQCHDSDGKVNDRPMCIQDVELVEHSIKTAFRKYLKHFNEKPSQEKVQLTDEKIGIFVHSGILELYEENEEIRSEVEEFSLQTDDVSLDDILMEEYVIKDNTTTCTVVEAPPTTNKKRKCNPANPSNSSKRKKSVAVKDKLVDVSSLPCELENNNFNIGTLQASDINEEMTCSYSDVLAASDDVEISVLGHYSYDSHTLGNAEGIVQDGSNRNYNADKDLNPGAIDYICEENVNSNFEHMGVANRYCKLHKVTGDSLCNATCQNECHDVESDIPNENMNRPIPSLENRTHKVNTITLKEATMFSEVGKMVLQGGVWKWKRNQRATDDSSSLAEVQKYKKQSIIEDYIETASDFNFSEQNAIGRSDISEGGEVDNAMEVDILQAAISNIFEMDDFALSVDEEPANAVEEHPS